VVIYIEREREREREREYVRERFFNALLKIVHAKIE
jgi:hypothetical protein